MCLKHLAHSRWSGNSGCIFAPSHNIITIHHHWRRQFGVLIWCPEDRSRHIQEEVWRQGQGERWGSGVEYCNLRGNSHISTLVLVGSIHDTWYRANCRSSDLEGTKVWLTVRYYTGRYSPPISSRNTRLPQRQGVMCSDESSGWRTGFNFKSSVHRCGWS